MFQFSLPVFRYLEFEKKIDFGPTFIFQVKFADICIMFLCVNAIFKTLYGDEKTVFFTNNFINVKYKYIILG